MQPLFDVYDHDRRFYNERLRSFLPERIIDIHTHIWREHTDGTERELPSRSVSWPSRVARDNSIEDLDETYRLLFPDKTVVPLLFSNVDSAERMDAMNQYVRESAARTGYPSLLFAHPSWSAVDFATRLRDGGYLGAKVYLSMSPAHLGENEITIYDFAPPHQLEVLDRCRGILMLHIPRSQRLRDAINLAQLREIDARYPDLQLIVAHVGRAYCVEDVGDAFDVLAGTRFCFDISANCNAEVFRRLLDAVGPGRVLFGSDMPILRMRTRRICEHATYVNLVPRGLYGDLTGEAHMREVDGAEADSITFFMYEEVDAFRRAAEAVGLTHTDISEIFHDHAARIIADAKAGLQM